MCYTQEQTFKPENNLFALKSPVQPTLIAYGTEWNGQIMFHSIILHSSYKNRGKWQNAAI